MWLTLIKRDMSWDFNKIYYQVQIQLKNQIPYSVNINTASLMWLYDNIKDLPKHQVK